jgi:protein TonB
VVVGDDADGDDIPDIAVGALGNDDGGVDAGKVYVYSGRDRSLIQSFTGRSGVTARDTARVARVKEAVQAIRKASDTLTLPETIYDSTQVDVMPILRRSVNAEYPETAMGSGLRGWVQVRILVLADGAPGKVDIADDAGLGPDFRLAALTAARQWFFLPATKDGEAVAAWTVFPIGFAPDEARRSGGAGDSTTGAANLDSLRRAAFDSVAAGASDTAGAKTQRAAQDLPGADSSPAGSTPRPDTLASPDSGSVPVPPATGSTGPPPAASTAAGPADSSEALTSPGSGPGETPDSALPVVDSGLTATLPAGRSVEVDLSRLYEISDVDIVPVLVAKVDPQYPAAARLAGDTATVLMRLMVDTLGAVARIEVKLCTVPGRGFEESATAAVRRWRFEPAKRAHHKVNCWVEYPLEFRI